MTKLKIIGIRLKFSSMKKSNPWINRNLENFLDLDYSKFLSIPCFSTFQFLLGTVK